jgi:hypothetical protein
MTECDICGEEHSEDTKSCDACHKVVKKYQNRTEYPMEEVRKALKKAYFHKDREKNESYFKCSYTGMKGKFNIQDKTLGTYKDALVLNLDHKNPYSDELVVAFNIINKMKADIPYDIFKKLVIALGGHFKEKNIAKLEKELTMILG